MENSDLEIIIAKVISGNGNSEEIGFIEEWKNEDKKNRDLFKELRKRWELSCVLMSEQEINEARLCVEKKIRSRQNH